MVKAKPEKRSKLFALVFVCLALVVILINSFLIFNIYSSMPVETRVIPVRFEVGDRLGVDLNTSALTFGKVFPGGSVSRELVVNNSYSFSVNVKFYPSSYLNSVISSPDKVTVLAGESKNIQLTLTVPKDYLKGNYSGELVVKLFKT